MMEIKVTAPVENTTAYLLNGITYVPHYKNKNLFVGPGYPVGKGNPLPKHTHTATSLLNAGAKEINLALWPRPDFFEAAALT